MPRPSLNSGRILELGLDLLFALWVTYFVVSGRLIPPDFPRFDLL